MDTPSGDVLNEGLLATPSVAARCSLLDKGDEGELGEKRARNSTRRYSKDRRIKALARQKAVKSDAGHILGKSN